MFLSLQCSNPEGNQWEFAECIQISALESVNEAGKTDFRRSVRLFRLNIFFMSVLSELVREREPDPSSRGFQHADYSKWSG